MGCLPLERTANYFSGHGDGCIESYNVVAKNFNGKLSGLVNKLNNELSGIKLIFSSPYGILMQMVRKPSLYDSGTSRNMEKEKNKRRDEAVTWMEKVEDDVGINLEPSARVKLSHPLDQVIGDITKPMKTRRQVRNEVSKWHPLHVVPLGCLRWVTCAINTIHLLARMQANIFFGMLSILRRRQTVSSLIMW
ncbi:GDSL esterase/lipase [Actinidia chinensis var. chinensis]|uniref:GDSL esterase/lipase n=1 Tax=Actinidia chinensis var. chinensis TaxID=1590841 RepID=A0A2R6QCU2_ACTCC|nr:GDSL esterase/lipase [Actinidia chinensis var. chinensis]